MALFRVGGDVPMFIAVIPVAIRWVRVRPADARSWTRRWTDLNPAPPKRILSHPNYIHKAASHGLSWVILWPAKSGDGTGGIIRREASRGPPHANEVAWTMCVCVTPAESGCEQYGRNPRLAMSFNPEHEQGDSCPEGDPKRDEARGGSIWPTWASSTIWGLSLAIMLLIAAADALRTPVHPDRPARGRALLCAIQRPAGLDGPGWRRGGRPLLGVGAPGRDLGHRRPVRLHRRRLDGRHRLHVGGRGHRIGSPTVSRRQVGGTEPIEAVAGRSRTPLTEIRTLSSRADRGCRSLGSHTVPRSSCSCKAQGVGRGRFVCDTDRRRGHPRPSRQYRPMPSGLRCVGPEPAWG